MQSPLQMLAGQGLGLTTGAPPGWVRLLVGDLGRDTGRLLPAAAVALVALVLQRRGGSRTDPVRAVVLLWVIWGACSASRSPSTPRSTATTPRHSPARWRRRAGSAPRRHGPAHRTSERVRSAVLIAVLATGGYGVALLWGAEADPTWLLPTLMAISRAALVPVAIRVERVGVDQLLVATPALVARTLPTLEKARAGAPDLRVWSGSRRTAGR